MNFEKWLRIWWVFLSRQTGLSQSLSSSSSLILSNDSPLNLRLILVLVLVKVYLCLSFKINIAICHWKKLLPHFLLFNVSYGLSCFSTLTTSTTSFTLHCPLLLKLLLLIRLQVYNWNLILILNQLQNDLRTLLIQVSYVYDDVPETIVSGKHTSCMIHLFVKSLSFLWFLCRRCSLTKWNRPCF